MDIAITKALCGAGRRHISFSSADEDGFVPAEQAFIEDMNWEQAARKSSFKCLHTYDEAVPAWNRRVPGTFTPRQPLRNTDAAAAPEGLRRRSHYSITLRSAVGLLVGGGALYVGP